MSITLTKSATALLVDALNVHSSFDHRRTYRGEGEFLPPEPKKNPLRSVSLDAFDEGKVYEFHFHDEGVIIETGDVAQSWEAGKTYQAGDHVEFREMLFECTVDGAQGDTPTSPEGRKAWEMCVPEDLEDKVDREAMYAVANQTEKADEPARPNPIILSQTVWPDGTSEIRDGEGNLLASGAAETPVPSSNADTPPAPSPEPAPITTDAAAPISASSNG